MTTTASADLELMRASVLLESDPPAAARRASEILAQYPGHAEASLLLASACRNLGDPATAASVLEAVVVTHADSPAILLELGRAYAAAGRASEAIAVMERAVAADPKFADGWRELAAQHFVVGDTLGGDRAYERYARLWRQPQELIDAVRALGDNRVEAAEQILRRRLSQAPHDVAALRLLTEAALRRGDEPQAERCLGQCLALAPGFAAARFDLARLLYSQARIAETLDHIARLLAAQPGNIEYLDLKAHCLRMLGRSDDALALIEGMIAEQPLEERVWVLYGTVLREVSGQDRSVEAYRQALRVRPGSANAYGGLANLKTYRFTPEDLTIMQEQLALQSVRSSERIQLEFALGAAFEYRGEYSASFEHYARGNALQRATLVYDPTYVTAQVHHSKALFNAQFFAEREGWGSEQADPVFIIGLPRSGSTLLEQMLSCHSQIEGTRELPDLPVIAFELMSRVATPSATTLFEQIGALQREEVHSFAARYLESTRGQRRLGKARFIDKLPGNWSLLGLVMMLFPRASIIDARRHPLGTGFSCYKQLFGRGQQFTYDLREIGLFSRDYISTMQHFDATLPGRVYRLHYEQLVSDPEGELRRVLAYCGLPFEERCLRFHENRRAVSTISSEQVRQPLYTEGVDQWRNYEPWLGPMKDALGELVGQYPQFPVA